ncbi:MAG: addiction module toxin RelE [Nanoarchaeota archaeon]
MRKFDIEKKLHIILGKLFKKDRLKYEIIWKKINEIANVLDVEHYKNLRAPLQSFKGVHIDTSFVLIFKYDKTNDKILFYDFDHHDNIYRKKG